MSNQMEITADSAEKVSDITMNTDNGAAIGQEITVRPFGASVPTTSATEGDVTSLMQMAIEQKVPVELLERLVALQERITERNARGAFFNALAAFQEDCPEIKHSKKVDYVSRSGDKVKYSYAPLPEITRTIRPFLRKHGFSLSWTVDLGGPGILNINACLRHIDGHQEIATFPVPTESKAGMSAAQKNGAALTYGRRQSLISVLGLTTADQDIDGAAGAEPDGEDLITDEQLANLTDLISEVNADKGRFLKFLEIEKLPDLRKAGYAGAVKALEEKRTKK